MPCLVVSLFCSSPINPKISKEGTPFPVPYAVATMSELIKSMKDDEEDDDDEDAKPTEVPLPNVKSEVLEKVIEFCKHHLVRLTWMTTL